MQKYEKLEKIGEGEYEYYEVGGNTAWEVDPNIYYYLFVSFQVLMAQFLRLKTRKLKRLSLWKEYGWTTMMRYWGFEICSCSFGNKICNINKIIYVDMYYF